MKNKTLPVLLVIIINTIIFSAGGKTKSLDGVEIAYTVYGKGDTALVFVHGWGWDQSLWKGQVSKFSSRHKVVTLDLAGHGQSGKNRKNFTIKAFSDDVVSVINKLKLSKVILVGHSMAGIINLEVYRQAKEKIVGLIGADTYQIFQQGENPKNAEDYLTTFKENYLASVREYVRTLFLDDADTTFVENIVKRMQKLPSKTGMDIFRNIYQYNSLKAAADLQPKIITVNGQKFKVKEAENIKLIPGFSAKYIPGTGHFPMLEKPEKFNELLQEAIIEIVK
ncbi:MAG: alpha/beta hydrolase [Ignavibacteria bacterium]|nr:MAG: alpha/beta hydrolase [Ignavibacteria bacterium]KAF0158554.1 MAG: alpha/beta hydrolase [Ignavibacteria bacterium]